MKTNNEATLRGIHSGNLDVALQISASGHKGGSLLITLFGPFQSEGKGRLPQLDLKSTVVGTYRGKEIDFEGGIEVLPNSAYVNYEGVEYEVDPTTFSFVEQTVKQMQREAGAKTGSAGAVACQEELGTVKFANLVEGAKIGGGAGEAIGSEYDLNGVPTTPVSGKLNASGA